MHVCIYQYTYCTPGTYYVLTAVVFLAQLQREIASKTNAVLLLLYSYLKKKKKRTICMGSIALIELILKDILVHACKGVVAM